MSVALIALATPPLAIAAPPSLSCDSTPSRETFSIPQPDGEAIQMKGRFNESVFIELNAGESFSRVLPYGWVFELNPTDHGWSIRLYDRESLEGRVDLTAITPPFRGPMNPRDVAGWHFRNAANTGPNTGDVNAPQSLRLFQFSVGLIGTGGFRPPTTSDGIAAASDMPASGRGWLRLLDYSLDPQGPSNRARLESIQFQACLSWPRPTSEQVAAWERQREESQREADARSKNFLPEEREEIGACGLDFSRYALEARILPRLLSFDIDGDEIADSLYQVRRRRDNAANLALCRAGTWLELIGPEHPLLSNGDIALIVRALEAWRTVPGDHGSFGYVDEPSWPRAEGDVVVLERIEKGMAILYREEGELRSRSIYRSIEP